MKTPRNHVIAGCEMGCCQPFLLVRVLLLLGLLVVLGLGGGLLGAALALRFVLGFGDLAIRFGLSLGGAFGGELGLRLLDVDGQGPSILELEDRLRSVSRERHSLGEVVLQERLGEILAKLTLRIDLRVVRSQNIRARIDSRIERLDRRNEERRGRGNHRRLLREFREDVVAATGAAVQMRRILDLEHLPAVRVGACTESLRLDEGLLESLRLPNGLQVVDRPDEGVLLLGVRLAARAVRGLEPHDVLHVGEVLEAGSALAGLHLRLPNRLRPGLRRRSVVVGHLILLPFLGEEAEVEALERELRERERGVRLEGAGVHLNLLARSGLSRYVTVTEQISRKWGFCQPCGIHKKG
jgi:hypothetical protein